MKIKILNETGKKEALLGLSLSYNTSLEKVVNVSNKLYNLDNGHNKFLESIIIWLDINAPRYWWQEFDTYRVGVTKQSESTIHTINKNTLTKYNFEESIRVKTLEYLNLLIKLKDFNKIKNELPEGFLQRRIICTNYKTIRNIIKQRKNHKLIQWKNFCEYIRKNSKYKEYLQ